MTENTGGSRDATSNQLAPASPVPNTSPRGGRERKLIAHREGWPRKREISWLSRPGSAEDPVATLARPEALQAGLDVYAEKPQSLTVTEGRALVQAAKKYDRVLQTGSQQRSMPINVYASKLVREGAMEVHQSAAFAPVVAKANTSVIDHARTGSRLLMLYASVRAYVVITESSSYMKF